MKSETMVISYFKLISILYHFHLVLNVVGHLLLGSKIYSMDWIGFNFKLKRNHFLQNKN